METKERQVEFFERRPFNKPLTNIQLEDDDKEVKDRIKSTIRWTQSLTFHVLMHRNDLWPLNMREELIEEVKNYAKSLNLDASSIKSETITRTWRYMKAEGIIKADAEISCMAEQAHHEHWGR